MTKDKIIKIALILFAKKGYDSTSIREIAKSVGIKESSIYSHFQSKKDIFKSIMDRYNSLSILTNFNLDELDKNPLEVFYKLLDDFFFLYHNEESIAYERLIEMESLKDSDIKDLILHEAWDNTENFFRNVLQRLIDNGFIKEMPMDILLIEYISPFYYIHTKLITYKFDENQKDFYYNMMKQHIKLFFEIYRR
jgi:AcrR family transcriptional regulator